jgi:hypothetical protein
MKRFILKCTGFLLATLVIYPLVLVFWGKVAPEKIVSNMINTPLLGFTAKKLAEVKHVSRPDILFLGSSHAYRSFDPRIFRQSGYTTFNLGTSQQTATITHWLASRYLHRVNPGLVVYVVDGGIISSSEVESAVDVIQNDSVGLDMVRFIQDVNHIKVLNAGLYHFAWDILPLETSHMRQKKRKVEKYISAGYSIYLKSSLKNKLTKSIKKFNLSNKNVESFKKTLALLKRHHIPYVLITAPFTRAYAVDHNTALKFPFKEYGSYTDFNARLVLDDSLHFYDAHHLNQAGVVVFNQHFIQWLSENGYGPSDRPF